MNAQEAKLQLSRFQRLNVNAIIQDGTFAEACYNQNSVYELISALAQVHADHADMEQWNLTPEKWRENVAFALRVKLAELIEWGCQ